MLCLTEQLIYKSNQLHAKQKSMQHEHKFTRAQNTGREMSIIQLKQKTMQNSN